MCDSLRLATKTEIERLMEKNTRRSGAETAGGENSSSTDLSGIRSQSGLIAGLEEGTRGTGSHSTRYEAMRSVLAVGKKGEAPGELYCPIGIAIETNSNKIYVVEGEVSSIHSLASSYVQSR